MCDRKIVTLILTNFKMLLRRPETFAQRNFYCNLAIIFLKINQQKLNLFEGLAEGLNGGVANTVHG